MNHLPPSQSPPLRHLEMLGDSKVLKQFAKRDHSGNVLSIKRQMSAATGRKTTSFLSRRSGDNNIELSSTTMRSPPVNDGLLSRLLVILADRLFRSHRLFSGRVLLLSKHNCIKYGQLLDLSCPSAMRFISEHRSIPVPKILCAFNHHSQTHIVMEGKG